MPESPDKLPTPSSATLPAEFPLPLPVALQRSDIQPTSEIALWSLIQKKSEDVSFTKYEAYIRNTVGDASKLELGRLPFPRVEVYESLKSMTNTFLMKNCGIPVDTNDSYWNDLATNASSQLGRQVTGGELRAFWTSYLGEDNTIPYFDRLRANHNSVRSGANTLSDLGNLIFQDRIKHPCMLELIWSYWHEEAMLVQVMNAISLRFQNRRGAGERHLANLELSPLRPISNLMWGYVQDEQHRLTIQRRNDEYGHQYGLRLCGKAVGDLEPADNRSHFLEGFHRLLHLTARFYAQDDDTTVRADGFPVLNALKDVHMTLGEGGSNQFGDLAWVARSEMLLQQWILSRPEMREFFASRPSVVYPEPWMQRIESAKSLLGMRGPNVLHMYYLATMGERLLLSIRYHPWSTVIDASVAASWARSFRSDVTGYINSYQAVTGADFSAAAASDRIDATLPTVLLRRRQEAASRR